jgi:hypothetical protein
MPGNTPSVPRSHWKILKIVNTYAIMGLAGFFRRSKTTDGYFTLIKLASWEKL